MLSYVSFCLEKDCEQGLNPICVTHVVSSVAFSVSTSTSKIKTDLIPNPFTNRQGRVLIDHNNTLAEY